MMATLLIAASLCITALSVMWAIVERKRADMAVRLADANCEDCIAMTRERNRLRGDLLKAESTIFALERTVDGLRSGPAPKSAPEAWRVREPRKRKRRPKPSRPKSG